MSTTTAHRSGFTDPVPDAQRTFRAALEAMSRPTLRHPIPAVVAGDLRPPDPLGATVAALLLTLCDDYTSIWLDPALRASDAVCTWLRFHTAAPIVDDPGEAMFVVVASSDTAPALHELAQGTDEAPHLSATLLIDASGTSERKPVTATGPGINGRAEWDGAGLPDGFLAQWQENRARFPCGIDVFFAHRTTVCALPRTTALVASDTEQEA